MDVRSYARLNTGIFIGGVVNLVYQLSREEVLKVCGTCDQFEKLVSFCKSDPQRPQGARRGQEMQEVGRVLRRALSLSGQLASLTVRGPVAQLGERCVRIAEVEGSNPFRSTIIFRGGLLR